MLPLIWRDVSTGNIIHIYSNTAICRVMLKLGSNCYYDISVSCISSCAPTPLQLAQRLKQLTGSVLWNAIILDVLNDVILECQILAFLTPLPLCSNRAFSLAGSHGANCAWQVRRCITAHSTDSGSHPSHPVSTPLLHASLVCLPACLALWVSAF